MKPSFSTPLVSALSKHFILTRRFLLTLFSLLTVYKSMASADNPQSCTVHCYNLSFDESYNLLILGLMTGSAVRKANVMGSVMGK